MAYGTLTTRSVGRKRRIGADSADTSEVEVG